MIGMTRTGLTSKVNNSEQCGENVLEVGASGWSDVNVLRYDTLCAHLVAKLRTLRDDAGLTLRELAGPSRSVTGNTHDRVRCSEA